MEEDDGLVLDLRDGYGACDLSDLDPFYRPKAAYPDLNAVNAAGIETKNRMIFDKPLVALINRGSRSGKELLAFGLKRSKRALLVGENSAGFLLAGKLFPIDRDSALYLAVNDVNLDGERLEGLGVAPDLPVLNEKGDQAGHDMQLKAALDALEKQIQSR
jgi:carboxyl-terminal processing protease